ncbi:MAG: Gfo/Idh/MocA family oxidoreductase [Thermoguttaceae bacterium]
MIRVGIAGIGFMGMVHYLTYRKIRGVKVAAICEKNFPERLAGDWRAIKGNFGPQGQKMDLSGITKYAEFDAMLADPNLDLIDICLPPAAHATMTIAALKAGKHVVCEKPIALKPSDATRMVDAARRAGKLLSIGQVLSFFPQYQYAYEVAQSGKFGRLLGGQFKRMISDPLWMRDFYDPEKCGGPMLDLHIHDAHFIRLMFGMPKAVQSVGTMRGQVVERFSTQFLFDPPRMVTAVCGVIGQQGRPFTQGFEIYFEKATLLFDYAALAKVDDAVTPLTVLSDDGKVTRPKLGSADPMEGFLGELGDVVRAVQTGKPSPRLDGQLARDAVVLCQKQTESVVRGRAVKV